MNISPGELSNVHKRVNYFLLAWGELDFEMMRLLSGKKLKGRLASFFKPSGKMSAPQESSVLTVVFTTCLLHCHFVCAGSSAITDATLQMLSGLWYAEQAHFGLRYHDFATKQSWFKRPKYGSANKHLDSMYTQVIDTLEKILDMVESSVGRDFASRSPIDMASRTERTTKAQAAFERTVAEFMSMLDYVRRIARVRTMLVPIYRSVLANTVPMRDHDIVVRVQISPLHPSLQRGHYRYADVVLCVCRSPSWTQSKVPTSISFLMRTFTKHGTTVFMRSSSCDCHSLPTRWVSDGCLQQVYVW